jgi:hypothetical protein
MVREPTVLRQRMHHAVALLALAAVVSLTGCATGPPAGSVSASQAKRAALEWLAKSPDFAAWRELAADPATPVIVVFMDDDPMVDDNLRIPVWQVEVTSPRTPADPKAASPKVTMYVSMSGAVSSFAGADTP